MGANAELKGCLEPRPVVPACETSSKGEVTAMVSLRASESYRPRDKFCLFHSETND